MRTNAGSLIFCCSNSISFWMWFICYFPQRLASWHSHNGDDDGDDGCHARTALQCFLSSTSWEEVTLSAIACRNVKVSEAHLNCLGLKSHPNVTKPAPNCGSEALAQEDSDREDMHSHPISQPVTLLAALRASWPSSLHGHPRNTDRGMR